MSECVAFIDVGTNSVHVLVVSFRGGSLGTQIYHDKESVRMGKSLYETGTLDTATLNKLRVVLSKFARIAKEQGAEEIIAMATCAAREAPNRQELVDLAKESGIDLRIIPGREEARLVRLGVAGPECARRTLCIDVGGGSTEIALAYGNRDLYLDSLSLGAIRMAYGTGIDQTGRVTPKEYETLKRKVAAQCYHSAAAVRDFGFDRVIGSSGTIEVIADVCGIRRGDNDSSYITRSELRSLMKQLCSMTASERCRIPKISANRADIVIGGGCVVEGLMDLFGIDVMEVSPNGLREGMKMDYLLKKGHSDFSLRDSSVKELATRCGHDTGHEASVRRYAEMLYREFVSVGILEPSDTMRELLLYAALLHDVGSFISYERHHVFSYTIIRNSFLAGFDSGELERMALMARFHHGSFPDAGSRFFTGMDSRDVAEILRYAMILKMADIMDRGRDDAIEDVSAEMLNGTVNLTVSAFSDVSLVEWKLATVDRDFAAVFGSRLNVTYLRI